MTLFQREPRPPARTAIEVRRRQLDRSRVLVLEQLHILRGELARIDAERSALEQLPCEVEAAYGSAA
jgi:hypothetical protein